MSEKKQFYYQIFNLLLLLAAVTISSCTPSKPQDEKAEEGTEKQIYIFDDSRTDSSNTALPAADSKSNSSVTPKAATFIVQVGAFTTRKNADEFARLFTSKTKRKVNVSFSSKVNLFVVQIDPVSTRIEADRIAGQLRKDYKDIFILSGE